MPKGSRRAFPICTPEEEGALMFCVQGGEGDPPICTREEEGSLMICLQGGGEGTPDLCPKRGRRAFLISG